jgi:hypothetical protein
MNEARRVIERLDRIEQLRRADAPAGVLLGEVRRLLAEGERWLAAEHEHGGERARAVFEDLRGRLDPAGKEAGTG